MLDTADVMLLVEDHLAGIFDSLKEVMALYIQQEGELERPTGIWVDFSNLRPAGAITGSGLGVSSGPMAFVEGLEKMLRQLRVGQCYRPPVRIVLSNTHDAYFDFLEAAPKLEESGCVLCVLRLDRTEGLEHSLAALTTLWSWSPDLLLGLLQKESTMLKAHPNRRLLLLRGGTFVMQEVLDEKPR